MTYYKVKESSDQIRHTIRSKKGTILVANELYSSKVISTARKEGRINEQFIDTHFTIINISPKDTYWFFGARFECTQ